MIEGNEPLVLMKSGAHIFTKWATYMKCQNQLLCIFTHSFSFTIVKYMVPNCSFLYCAPCVGENSNDYKVSPRNNSYKLSAHILKGSIIASRWLKTKQLELKYIMGNCPCFIQWFVSNFSSTGPPLHFKISDFFAVPVTNLMPDQSASSGRQPRNVDKFFNFSSLQVAK